MSIMNIFTIAKVAHEINRAYCISLGDNSQPDWENAPKWQIDSAVKGVEFHIMNPEVTPEQSHGEWLDVKKAEGWKWGKVKNAEKKEHPCYCPYDELPEDQKAKDFIFSQVVKSLNAL